MMERRTFLAMVPASLLAVPVGAEAQRVGGGPPGARGTLPRVGYLGAGYPSDRHPLDAFASGLRELDYVDGQTVTIEWRFAEGQYARLPHLAGELVRLGVDVIFAPGDHTAIVARQATTTIPIVFTGAADPVASGFAVSLARPGRNMTGLTQAGPELSAKRLSLLKEAIVNLSRVAILRNPDQTTNLPHLTLVQDAARPLRLACQVFETRGPREFDDVFRGMVKNHAQAVLMLPDNMFWANREKLGELAQRHRLPMSANRAEYVRAGALMAYGSSLNAEWRRGGVFVGRILNGTKPADIPIEEPTTFELVINLKTAKALGLTIPPSLLQRADQVIE